MKKHKNILIILSLGVIFIIALLISEQSSESNRTQIIIPLGSKQLQQRIDSLGKAEWNESNYLILKSDIGASEMAKEITPTELDYLVKSLEQQAANAMVISFDNWTRSNCGESSGNIKNLVSKMNSQKSLSVSPDLIDRLNVYSNFQVFLGLGSRVNHYLASKYNSSIESNLINQINSLATSKGLRDCSSMQVKKNEWLNQLKEMNKIDVAYNLIVNGTWKINCEPFLPYKFYREDFQKKNRCNP
jgi:hypothetical protein